MRIIHYEAEKRYVDAGMQLCTVFYANLKNHSGFGIWNLGK